VFDWCANGQQLKCLTVSDEWTKEGLAIEVDDTVLRPNVIAKMENVTVRMH
jgi:putative transposase